MERLSTAADIMVSRPITVTPETRVLDAIAQLLEKRVTGAPVVDSIGLYRGVFSEKCALEALAGAARRYLQGGGGLPELQARDIMTSDLVTLSPQIDAFDAISQLLDNRISGAPVLDSCGRLLGVFSEKSSMSVLLGAAYDQLPTSEVAAFMDRDLGRTVTEDTGLLTLADRFITTPYRRLPVLRDEVVVGQISRRDVLKAALDLANAAPDYLNSVRGYPEASGLNRVDSLMDVNARTIMPDIDLLRIATIFRSTPYRQLPVVSGLDLVGLVSRRDVLLATRRMMAKGPRREQTFLYLSAIAGREAVNLD